MKKSIKYKKYLKIVEVLKEFINTTMITKQILNLEINLIVRYLSALAFTIQKSLFGAIIKDKIYQFFLYSVNSKSYLKLTST